MYKTNNLYDLLSLAHIDNCESNKRIILRGIQLDSRKIKKGDLFIAVKGLQDDGRLYINRAIEQGAIAVLSSSITDQLNRYVFIRKNVRNNQFVIPIIYVDQLHQYISNIAGYFYAHPSLFMHVVGVTGTNGKTTVTHLLAHWMQLLGEKSAVIGTLGNGMLHYLNMNWSITTPSAVDAQKILAQLFENEISFIAMEVSSHGLAQYRVDGLYFDVAVFTNLSHDHLDYHDNIMQYEMSKWRLFSELHVKQYIINADDPIGIKWLSRLPQAIAVATNFHNLLCVRWKGKWICAIKINYYLYGTDIIFCSSWGKGIIHSQLLGIFNVSNLLLSLGVLLALGYPLSLLLSKSSFLQPVCGRMEVLQNWNQSTVIIDYAHTPDALKQVLMFIKQYYCIDGGYGKLWCIFGCGGDRDRGKRMLMGSIVDRYADNIVITSDNPRTEDPQAIIDDILCGIRSLENIKIIKNRVQAIYTVLEQSNPEDVIVITGKGHETYQISGNDCIYHSDQDIVKDFFKK